MAVTWNRSSKTATFCLLAGIAGLVAACGIWYVKAIRPPKVIDLQEFVKKIDVDGPRDPVHLRTLSVSGGIRDRLLDGDFTIVYRMQNISADCRVVFAANPGQEFNYGDAIIEGLPYRQLHFAGMSPKSCFIYYERGGNNYPSSCLAVLNREKGKVIWLGVTRKKAGNLHDLRSLLSHDQFDDRGGPDC
jgi:hypothetical protein